MTRNVGDEVRRKIARGIADQTMAYDRLVRAALRAVERCERKRLARGMIAPEAFTATEQAWFRGPIGGES